MTAQSAVSLRYTALWAATDACRYPRCSAKLLSADKPALRRLASNDCHRSGSLCSLSPITMHSRRRKCQIIHLHRADYLAPLPLSAGLDVRDMRNTVLTILLSIMLISCGSSYSVPRATLHIDVTDAEQFNILRDSISDFLMANGFADLGKDEEMLDLLEWSSKKHQGDAIAKTNSDQINRIHK